MKKYVGRQNLVTTARWDEDKGGARGCILVLEGISQSIAGKVFLIYL